MKEIKEFKNNSVIINRKGKDQKFLPFTSVYPHSMKGVDNKTMFLLGRRLHNIGFLSSINMFGSSAGDPLDAGIDTHINDIELSKILYLLSIKDYLLSKAKPFDLKDSLNIQNVRNPLNGYQNTVVNRNSNNFLECVPAKLHIVNQDKKLILHRSLLIDVSTNKIVGGVFIDKAQSMAIKRNLIINHEKTFFNPISLKRAGVLNYTLKNYAEVWLDYDIYKYLFNNTSNYINNAILNSLLSNYRNLRIIKSSEIDSYFFEPEENITVEDTEKLAKGTLDNLSKIDDVRTEKLGELWK